jgi:DNA repair exonuclease SbcCD nuclease subunit
VWTWDRGPVAFYSGSIERTSSDIWKEEAPKGVVIFDTDSKALVFKEIETRPMFDIDAVEYAGIEPFNRFLAKLLEDGARDMLLRLKVEGFPRGDRDSIDWRTVAALKDAHVHFHLDLRYAERDVRDLGDRRERAGRTLADDAVAFFDADEDAVRDAAFAYLGLDVPALTLT